MGMDMIPERQHIDTATYQQQRAITAAFHAGTLTSSQFKRWSNALKAATASLNERRWRWNGSTLVMRSVDGLTQYRVTGTGCECVAAQRGKPCQHRMARRVITTALAIQASEFVSVMESRLPRITPGELAAERMAERATDADMAALQEAVDELVA